MERDGDGGGRRVKGVDLVPLDQVPVPSPTPPEYRTQCGSPSVGGAVQVGVPAGVGVRGERLEHERGRAY